MYTGYTVYTLCLGLHLNSLCLLLYIVPIAPPQNVSGSALSSTLIMLQWSTPPPLDINGIIRHYTVSAVERHTGRQWTFFAIEPDFHVGSLHPFYYYDFNVSATTVGPGPFSSRYSILTDQERKLWYCRIPGNSKGLEALSIICVATSNNIIGSLFGNEIVVLYVTICCSRSKFNNTIISALYRISS